MNGGALVGPEALRCLGRQAYFWNQYQHLLPRLQHPLHHLKVDFGLTRARDALKEGRAEDAQVCGKRRHRGRLLRVERGASADAAGGLALQGSSQPFLRRVLRSGHCALRQAARPGAGDRSRGS